MIETILLFIGGFVIGVGIHRTMKERRDRKALRGDGLSLEKKLLAATVKLKAAEQENDEIRGYLGLNPVRREALVDEVPPVAGKKVRAKKKSDPDSPAAELKGLSVGAGSIPLLMLSLIGTSLLVKQQKKKGQTKKSKDLKDLKARLKKKAHPAEPFSKSDKSLMELKRRLSEKLQD